MAEFEGKQQVNRIDGTPEKRLFLSIISDYDLRTGLCELVDNAIDLWVSSDKESDITIDIVLDADRQLINVSDNAGGVREGELRLLVAPGASSSGASKALIGTFGVGGKRAGVALGEQVEIRTRFKKERSLQIDINNEWLASPDWHVPAYEIAHIRPGTTSVSISRLRQSFTERDVEHIREHLGETYALFLREGCRITLNGSEIKAATFDSWAYPPEFLPRTTTFKIAPTSDGVITATIDAGLIRDRIPYAENYGVYFYCNNRLIVKELRTRDVGYFVTREAGVPHPDASLCRVIVYLVGPADRMPWNSSKSGLNFSHPAFTQLRSKLIELVSYFSSLSRRLKNEWDDKVFSYPNGNMETITESDVLSERRIVLPVLPRTRRLPRVDVIKANNSKVLREKPWTLGLIEALGLVDIIFKQSFETKNRAALILLDSNFEIALKEFIVNRTDLFQPHKYPDIKIAEIFKARHKVIQEVAQHVTLSPTLLSKVNYFYNLRNKLVHERATVGITDNQIHDYQRTIESVLKMLFQIKFPQP